MEAKAFTVFLDEDDARIGVALRGFDLVDFEGEPVPGAVLTPEQTCDLISKLRFYSDLGRRMQYIKMNAPCPLIPQAT